MCVWLPHWVKHVFLSLVAFFPSAAKMCARWLKGWLTGKRWFQIGLKVHAIVSFFHFLSSSSSSSLFSWYQKTCCLPALWLHLSSLSHLTSLSARQITGSALSSYWRVQMLLARKKAARHVRSFSKTAQNMRMSKPRFFTSAFCFCLQIDRRAERECPSHNWAFKPKRQDYWDLSFSNLSWKPEVWLLKRVLIEFLLYLMSFIHIDTVSGFV